MEYVEQLIQRAIINIREPFESHMSIQKASKLEIGDKIDHRRANGQFVIATIADKEQQQETNLKIRYDHDDVEWSDFEQEIYRFAKPGSISKRLADHRHKATKIGDKIFINPIHTHPGWKWGEIRDLDEDSGQVWVGYFYHDRYHSYWTHLDNKQEILSKGLCFLFKSPCLFALILCMRFK